jgi:sugar phosphate permease
MMDEGIIDAGIAGIISAVYFICYATGQIFNGILADRKSPFVMVMVGLSVVTLSNIAMTISGQPSWLLILWWGINGLGQSMLWSPVFFIVSNVLHSKVKFTAITMISVCTPAGKTSCALLSGAALTSGKWQSVFYAASFVIAAMLVLWITIYLSVKKDIIIRRPAPIEKGSEDTEKAKIPFGRLVVASGMILALPSLMIHGLFLNGVTEVIPSILTREYALTPSASALLDSIIPVVGVFGVFFCNFVYFKLCHRNEIKCANILMALNILPVLVMLVLAFALDGSFLTGQLGDAIIFVVTYGLIYILQLGFGHAIISLMAMRYSKFGLAATMTGLLNAVNYGGSAIATYGMSYAVESLPLWQTVIIWLVCLVFAFVFLTLAQGKWTKFSKQEKFD